MRSRKLVGVVTALCLLASPGAFGAKNPQTIERFTCFAVNMTGVGGGGTAMVQIAIERWSSEAERDMLRATLTEKGPNALLGTLQSVKPRVGFMRLPNTMGWDLYFARDVRNPDGTRQVILATDRHVGFGEVVNNARSMDYEFTLVDIRFDADGKGTGKLSLATKISVNEKTKQIELENWGSRPVDLINVKTETPKPKTK